MPPAPKPKRIRRDPETSRTLILDQAERIMVEQGYAAVSSRSIAKSLGINAATVHYYYPTTDDIFLAMMERLNINHLAEMQTIYAAPSPLLAYWQHQSSWSKAGLAVEILALCNHRKSLQSHISASANLARISHISALTAALQGKVELPQGVDTLGLATILTAVGRLLLNEQNIGITSGHFEVRALVEAFIAGLDISAK